jgi:hypothetical protein
MPAIVCNEELDPGVQAKVRARFSRDIEDLGALGFRELCFYREQFGLFSGLLSLPTFLLMWANREVMSLHPALQAGASFILMYHNNPATVAVPLRLGVKLYTGLTDRTLVISTSFASCALPRDGGSVIKNSAKRTLLETWGQHQQRIRETQAEGKQVSRSDGLQQYLEFSHQEDAALV